MEKELQPITEETIREFNNIVIDIESYFTGKKLTSLSKEDMAYCSTILLSLENKINRLSEDVKKTSTFVKCQETIDVAKSIAKSEFSLSGYNALITFIQMKELTNNIKPEINTCLTVVLIDYFLQKTIENIQVNIIKQ